MAELQNGDKVGLSNGKSCEVKRELGRGGQGIVYLVNYEGREYALKWYLKDPGEKFYANLCGNVSKCAPSANFVWPLFVTSRLQGSFGYLMAVRPSGYYDMSEFLLLKHQFKSVEAQFNACLEICDAFRKLHALGLSYQDLNDGNFFIDPATGHVLICDNDNVVPDGTDTGVCGKVGYMAPEIIEGSHPNRYSDYFSLAVCLFMLIYMNRPFEGVHTLSCPCMNDPVLAKKIYGSDVVFIMDPGDQSNRPVRGLHANVIRRWPMYPANLRDAFCRTFSREAIKDQTRRLMESEWIRALLQARSLLVKCPACGNETFASEKPNEVATCLWCKKGVQVGFALKVKGVRIPLVPGQKIYACEVSDGADFTSVAAVTIERQGTVGLRNVSGDAWSVTLADGSARTVVPQSGMPAHKGYRVLFGNQGETATIED